MDLVAIEQSLLQTAATLVIDPRVLRRVIKADRNASGLVPHAHSYTMSRDALCQIVGQAELGVAPAHLPEQLILLARPSSRSFSGRSEAQVLTRFWRAIFHARVHQVLEDLAHRGVLDSPGLRERIERLGQTEFDEVRSTLLHDDLVLPPCSDQEVYIEFAALYLELRYFAPGLLVTTFPGLASFELVDDALAADVDVTPLLEQGRPAQVAPPVARTLSGTKAPSYSAPAAFGLAEAVTLKPVSPRKHQRLLDGAEKARKKGNDVRAALLCARAAHVPDPEAQRAAQSAAKKDLAQLGARVSRALEPPGGASETFAPSWSSLLLILGDRAASERALRYSVEARLLFTVQKAAIAFERPNRAVSVATWMFSRGKRPIVRDLPSTRELRVARYLQVAAKMVRHTRVGAADRKLLGKLLDWATDRADANVRAALRPKLLAVFEQVGLVAASAPEQLARHKLIEELLDEVVTRGFISFASLRDALSRNQLKLQDLSGGRELISGDALLKADAALAIELDGIYRRGEIYLRGMQKASSIPFGTRVGRVLTLYLILPVGAAFLLLEGVGHIIGPLLVKLGFARIRPLNLTSLAICSALILALLHSAAFRAFAKQLLDVISWVFVALFLRLPRALFSRPAVRRIFQLPLVRLTIRRVLIPVAIAVGVFFIPPLRRHDLWLTLAVCFGSFAVSSLVLGSRLGAWVEDLFFDQLAPTWHVVSRQLVPGLFRFIARMFAGLMDLLQRGIYRIDELMLFRDGQNPIMLVLKATVGMVWGTIAYVIRLYVTLLIEPEVNPLKHFPVVTVAHKLMLPWTPAMLAALRTPLAPFGDVVANTIAGVTVFLIPSIFGFLAWELKENYKLYQASRSIRLPIAALGPHGETMRRLLVVGFHSGTLPKLYERLRRAAQREDEAAAARRAMGREEKAGGGLPSLGRFRQGIYEVEQSLRHFVERELVALLSRAARWTYGALAVEGIKLSSNRIRIELSCVALGPDNCEITIEEQSGFLVAGIGRPGFLVQLAEQSPEAMRLFENALAGLYQRAEIDLVREQIEAEIGEQSHYDIADEGLVVWPGHDFRTELVYRIGDRVGKTIQPKVSGEPPQAPVRVIDTRNILFRAESVDWLAWVASWSAADHPSAAIARLLRGTSILPRVGTHSAVGPDPASAAVAQPEAAQLGAAQIDAAQIDAAQIDAGRTS